MVYLDTDVVIDILRGKAEAKTWFSTSSEILIIPGVVAMELVVGCQNQQELAQLQKFLQRFTVAHPDTSDFAKAYELLAAYRLSSALSIPDAIIAAMVLNQSARLYTFNIKHYRMITGLDVQAPYQR